jgi:hypothetical protein
MFFWFIFTKESPEEFDKVEFGVKLIGIFVLKDKLINYSMKEILYVSKELYTFLSLG